MKKANRHILFILLPIVIILIILVVYVMQKKESITKDEESTPRIEDSITKMPTLDPSDVLLMTIYDCEAESYDNKAVLGYVEDPAVIRHIITNLNSLSIKECDPSLYRDNSSKGLLVSITCNELDDEGIRKGYSFEVLGKNESGNYILSFASYNSIVMEVVDGKLDYNYLKEVYSGLELYLPGVPREEQQPK